MEKFRSFDFLLTKKENDEIGFHYFNECIMPEKQKKGFM